MIIVRDEDEQKDWLLPDGTPLIREIHINLTVSMPVVIDDFRPIPDVQWAKEHNIEEMSIKATDAEILLENTETGETKSLYDYFNSIPRNKTKIPFRNTHKEDFKSLFLHSNGKCIKIKSIEVDYIAPAIEERTIKIAPEVKGVIEYLNKKRKVIILQEQTDESVKAVTIKTL